MGKISKKQIMLGAAGVVVFLIIIQLVPAGRTNPPVTSEIAAPPEVAAILQRACYDCHSNKTVWPWYSKVAPMSWKMVKHVNEGRDEMNFTEWDSLTARKQFKAQEKCWEEVQNGKMPLPGYLTFHPDAKLSDADKAILEAWGKEGEVAHDILRDKEKGTEEKGPEEKEKDADDKE